MYRTKKTKKSTYKSKSKTQKNKKRTQKSKKRTQKSKKRTQKYKNKNKNKYSTNHTNHSHLTNHTHHIQYKFYDRKSDILKFQYTPKLRGGRFLDKGGFGCVITPALACTNSDVNLDKSVSKIIKQQTNDVNKELKISSMLKKLDPGQNFYITVDKYCFINEIPANRTDLTNVKYKDDDLSDYSIINNNENKLDKNRKKKKLDKIFCDINLDLKPINLIMPYAGISLSSIMKTNRKGNDIKAKMHQMFNDNLKIYFKHLIIGLLKMHNNRIVNKDIKQKNIMLLWDSDGKDGKDGKNGKNGKNIDKNIDNIMAIRYIDFGLSQFLTGDFCSNINNISLKGTPFYLPPDLYICAFIIKYKDQPEKYQIKKIKQHIEKHVIKALGYINEKEIIRNMNSIIDTLYDKIKSLYEKDKILFAYFGSDTNKYNGFLQKADVYALGLSIYETLYRYSEINVKSNEKLYDLLLHMIDMNPDKRYNIVQCLGHPYFTLKK